MARKASNADEPEDEIEPTDEDDLEDLEDDEDEVAVGVAIAGEGDDEEGEDASLEDLLAQRATGRRAAGEADEDEDDILALSRERELALNEQIKTKVIPIKDRQEFVCNRCHLVKARSQLADEDRVLCRDCV